MVKTDAFQDQVIVVTGAARGIGKAIAQTMAQAGGHMMILDILEEEAAQVADGIVAAGGAATAMAVDATDAGQVEDVVGRIVTDWRQIDVLVNNIGWNNPTPFLESDEALWQQLLDVNLLTGLRFCRAVLPHMVNRQEGRIVNIASIAAIHPWPGSVLYGVAKAGVVSMTRSLAAAMAEHNIRVNCICPGPTETELSKRLRETDPEYVASIHGKLQIGHLADPEEIAAAVAFLASDESSFVLGECLVVDGGYNMV
jgi:2-hydroxycyclohexanecarboxyl-CoA dehydrogenase